MKSRIVRSLVIITAALGLGTGCGGTLEEQLEPTQELEVLAQEAEAEEPRKVEDLLGALDRTEGALHVVDTEQEIALAQLEAVKVADGTFQTKDPLTGELTKFRLVPYPISRWPFIWKICSNGQIVPNWVVCPTNIYSDPYTRIWKNSKCNRKIQSASWSACTNTSSGGSYNFQYREAWKCGVGTGYCVERRAVKTVRYNYDLAWCDPSIVTGITPVSYDFLCKP
ncbi:MAG: hypothetical protein JXB05_03350 [Myxococcaceae bacterium]|nr:hypothetical protein [Myxococcaceae bacterium]